MNAPLAAVSESTFDTERIYRDDQLVVRFRVKANVLGR